MRCVWVGVTEEVGEGDGWPGKARFIVLVSIELGWKWGTVCREARETYS